jgi:hypothetical protein
VIDANSLFCYRRIMLSADDVRQRLADECYLAGSQAAWARAHKLSGPYVNDVINGRREPGQAILDALKIERVTGYRECPVNGHG